MRKISFLLFFFFSIVSYTSYGFSIIKHEANEVPSADKYLQASEFVKLSSQEFSAMTGKKMNFFQRLSFGVLKIKMRHDLKKNPGLKVSDYFFENKRPPFKPSYFWLLLGLAAPIVSAIYVGSLGVFFAVALAPVFLAYITKNNPNKLKSVWLGFGVSMLLLIVFGVLFFF